MALTEAAARAIIQGAGFPTANLHSLGTIRRIASNLQKQAASGVPYSLPAARGHRVTPEHPERRRPALPAPASQYPHRPAQRSRYERITQPMAPRGPRAPAPPVYRPTRHDHTGAFGQLKQATQPEGFAGTFRETIVERFTSRVAAARYIRSLAASDPYGRIVIDGYDCTRPRGGRWSSVFANRGHTPGISLDGGEGSMVAKLREYGGNLEATVMAYAGMGRYVQRGPALSHVCAFIVYYYPGPMLERKREWRRASQARSRAAQLTQGRLI